MPRSSYFTADDVRAMPADGNRYETVHGELLVTPAPRHAHQQTFTRLMALLIDYLRPDHLDELLSSPADISWSDDTLVQPDLFVANVADVQRSGEWRDVQTLWLVIEIVSPSTARADRFTKRRLYQEQLVGTYWIVDIDQRHVEVWTPELQLPQIEREAVSWRHPAMTAECVIDLRRLFERIRA